MTDATRRTLRTAFQTGVALAAALPVIASATGISGTVPGVAAALAVSAAVTRIMALPLVDGLLPKWLRKGA